MISIRPLTHDETPQCRLSFDMKTIMFNIHDLALVATLGLCGLLALACSRIGGFKYPSRQLLTAFFVVNGMIALDTLVFWGDGVRYAAFELSPWLLMSFSFATFAFGPLLLWVIRCEVSPQPKAGKSLLLHLLPAIATPFYLYFVFYRHPLDVQRDLILNLNVYSVPAAHFSTFIALKAISPVIYGLLSHNILRKQSLKLSECCDELRQLLYLTVGFTFIRAWILVTHLVGLWLPLLASDVMGIIGNYLTLSLLMGFIALNLKQQSKPDAVPQVQVQARSEEANALQLSEEIEKFVRRERPYLDPQLNLERFARQLNVSPRRASVAINRGCQQNFQEYINRHRVEEAKRLLTAPGSHTLPIVEIARLAGFNSKATFNRIFKSQEAITPTLYRQKSLPDFPNTCQP